MLLKKRLTAFLIAFAMSLALLPLLTIQEAIAAENNVKSITDAEKQFDFNNTVKEDTVLCAEWVPISYSVQFLKNIDPNLDTPFSQTFTYDTEQALQANMWSREGYLFAGWNTERNNSGTSYSDGQNVKNLIDKHNETVNLYAQWKTDRNGNGIADDEETKYTVTYTDGLNGEIFQEQTTTDLLYGDKTPAFNGGAPSRTGYTFRSWYPKFSEMVQGNVRYIATWERNAYPITWHCNGGSIVGGNDLLPDHYLYDAGFTLPDAEQITRTGYTFAGWYEDENFSGSPVTHLPETTMGSKAFYARWNAEAYNVTLHSNGGMIADEKNVVSYTYGEGAALPAAGEISRQCHTFGGWYTDNSFSDSPVTRISDTEMEDKAFYAKWTENHAWEDHYTVDMPATFEAEGQASIHCQNCEAKKEVQEIPRKRSKSSSARVYSSISAIIPDDQAAYGTVTISPSQARRGDTVAIQVSPKDGYVLEAMEATDSSGRELALTSNESGRYTFTMPGSDTQVKVSFMADNSVLNYFYDVPNDAYYYEAVKWALGESIAVGIGYDLFGPDLACTRAQIVTFLWRAAGSPATDDRMNFKDVPADAWYAEAVRWAVSQGITAGTGNEQFSPDATCTRAEAVTFLARALHKENDAKPASSSTFSGVPGESYYSNAVAWDVESGVTSGVGHGLFGPDENCTRAQIIAFLHRADQGNK